MVMDGRARTEIDNANVFVVEEKIDAAKKWIKDAGDSVIIKVEFTGKFTEEGQPMYSQGEIVFDPNEGKDGG